MKLFLACMLVLKRITSLAQRLLNLLMEPGSKLLYLVCVEPQNVIGRILYIEFFFG
jgi:hypothetical protein